MSKSSNGLDSRLANIDLDTSSGTKSPSPHGQQLRKQYPGSLCPQNHATTSRTTPSKGPRLSTAARAYNRTNTMHKSTVSVPNPQKRNLDQTHQREVRDGCSTPLLSFMRETSSSRNKQSLALPATILVGTNERELQPARSSSHSDIYTRRSHHYGTLAPKKRQVLKPTRFSEESDKLDKLKISNKVCFIDKTTVRDYSPSRDVSAGHLPNPKDGDVYARLYPGSKKARQTEEQTLRPSVYMGSTRSSSRPKPASPLGTSKDKPHSVEELYHLIYRADPGLFTASNSLDSALIPKDAIPTAELLDSQRGSQFNVYERGEILRNSNIHYVPPGSRESTSGPNINVSSFKNNYGFDDVDGNYIIRPQDHIEYRYEIVRVLGTGSFGNVVHCKDHKFSVSGQQRNVAIKLIKNELDWSLQAVSEIKLLKHLMAASKGTANQYIMNYCDHFHFRGHMCIVSELLSLNFYTLLELGNFKGMSLGLVKDFSSKILKGLKFIQEQNVIHCDIKPENIMLRLPSNFQPGDTEVEDFQVKIIDFGSSCFESETSFSYIQSRFYRAPEVILGSKYSYEIDIWSFGCVIAELFTGTPLLPGRNEIEQIALIIEMFGAPPSAFILSERKRLLRSIKMDAYRKLNAPSATDGSIYTNHPNVQIDEKKLKKTLLYTLFNLEGKLNLQFLNLQLQAIESKEHSSSTTPYPLKRNVKIGAKSLDVSLRLFNSSEEKPDQVNFSKFMSLIFQWNPTNRPTTSQLLETAFLRNNMKES